jgi:hypothetical protein
MRNSRSLRPGRSESPIDRITCGTCLDNSALQVLDANIGDKLGALAYASPSAISSASPDPNGGTSKAYPVRSDERKRRRPDPEPCPKHRRMTTLELSAPLIGT